MIDLEIVLVKPCRQESMPHFGQSLLVTQIPQEKIKALNALKAAQEYCLGGCIKDVQKSVHDAWIESQVRGYILPEDDDFFLGNFSNINGESIALETIAASLTNDIAAYISESPSILCDFSWRPRKTVVSILDHVSPNALFVMHGISAKLSDWFATSTVCNLDDLTRAIWKRLPLDNGQLEKRLYFENNREARELEEQRLAEARSKAAKKHRDKRKRRAAAKRRAVGA